MHRAFFRVSSTFLGVAIAAAAGLGGGTALAAKSARHMTRIKGSYLPTTATQTGQLSASRMSVDVVLQPGNEAGLNSLLQSQYTQGSSEYGQWLAAGQFDAKFAPAQSTVQALTSYLRNQGLTVQQTQTPFLIRAIGSSA